MKETLIQKNILDYLKIQENLGKCYSIRTGSGKFVIPSKNGNRYFSTGRTGCPDIVLVFNGRFIALEVKTPKGVQRRSQKIAQKQIEKAGGEYYIVRSLADTILILNSEKGT